MKRQREAIPTLSPDIVKHFVSPNVLIDLQCSICFCWILDPMRFLKCRSSHAICTTCAVNMSRQDQVHCQFCREPGTGKDYVPCYKRVIYTTAIFKSPVCPWEDVGAKLYPHIVDCQKCTYAAINSWANTDENGVTYIGTSQDAKHYYKPRRDRHALHRFNPPIIPHRIRQFERPGFGSVDLTVEQEAQQRAPLRAEKQALVVSANLIWAMRSNDKQFAGTKCFMQECWNAPCGMDCCRCEALYKTCSPEFCFTHIVHNSHASALREIANNNN